MGFLHEQTVASSHFQTAVNYGLSLICYQKRDLWFLPGPSMDAGDLLSMGLRAAPSEGAILGGWVRAGAEMAATLTAGPLASRD